MAMGNRTWELAYRGNRKVFYEPATDTIRQCPENYLLAGRGADGLFCPMPDKASTINGHSLGIVLGQNPGAHRCPATLAALVEAAFWGTNPIPLVTFDPKDKTIRRAEWWKELHNLLGAGGRVEIGPALWDYYRDVLPPKSMGETYTIAGKPIKTSFGYAEGRDWIIGFWRECGRCYAQRTEVMASGY